jgi:hypothetical protein
MTTLNSDEEYHDYLQNNKVTPNDNELYCMLMYLRYLYSIHKRLPINIKDNRESPDFLIKIDDIEIGLEHTRAASQTLTYGEKKLDDYPIGSLLEIPDCQNTTPTKKSIEEVIRKPGEKLKSAGWGDWGPERFLISEIIISIEEKTKKLNDIYEICSSNELIIYDSIRIPRMRWDYVINELKQQYTKIDGRNFDKIHLVAEDKLRPNIMAE